MRIIYMGTPEFAVEPLKLLLENNYNVVAVITVPDKPAGRGQQLQQSAVKKFAIENGLTILQPEKLKNELFLEQLRNLNADLQIVVAFRMLPEVVWNMPRLGTFNLHGSLLPQYRGAAPINWAVINGDTETGVSTFFLQHEIDTGKIIYQDKIEINDTDCAGDIHDRLMLVGSKLVLKTVKAIEDGNYPQINQNTLLKENTVLKNAPKLFKEDCRIDWKKTTIQIYNHIRGLSPYPAAYTEIVSPDGAVHLLKIFKTKKEQTRIKNTVGSIDTDAKTYLKIVTSDGLLHIEDLQLAGKKRMLVADFLRGFPINNQWKAI
ncbi:MAG: methionyl-tRNA formyltransferase [Bacteroidia bacterium]